MAADVKVCRHCGEEIKLVQGLWFDGTYETMIELGIEGDFPALCETGSYHEPEVDESEPLRRPPSWRLVDSRSGKVAGVSSYMTEEQALRALANVAHNVAHGRRPDLADLLPHLRAVQMSVEEAFPEDDD